MSSFISELQQYNCISIATTKCAHTPTNWETLTLKCKCYRCLKYTLPCIVTFHSFSQYVLKHTEAIKMKEQYCDDTILER